MNVAVIAEGGEIVDTDLAGETFGERAGRETGDVGQSYVEAANEDDGPSPESGRSSLASRTAMCSRPSPP